MNQQEMNIQSEISPDVSEAKNYLIAECDVTIAAGVREGVLYVQGGNYAATGARLHVL